MPALKIEGLYEIKGKVLRSSVLESGKSAARITVHMGTCGISSGAADILQVFANLQAASLNSHLPAFDACN